MKIGILGAGAMGSAIGAVLAKAGNDVTLVDVWKEAVEAINRVGLKVQNKAGEIAAHKIRAVNSPVQVAGPVDLLLVFVKCYHTVEAVKSALPVLGPDSTVLSLQNGWGNGPRIAEVVGRERVVLGVCYHSATVLGPGHVLHAGQGKTFIGEMDGAVTMQSLMRALLLEVVSVAQLQGIALDFTERWNAITSLLGKLAPNTKGSMLQDVENRRRTEIDVMCGAIVEAGQRLGFATPYNNAMLWLVKALEANYSV